MPSHLCWRAKVATDSMQTNASEMFQQKFTKTGGGLDSVNGLLFANPGCKGFVY